MAVHKWEDLKARKLSPEARERVRKQVEADLVEMNLAELRKELGLTQADLATAAEMSQGELSRAERREDHLVSTLRRYVEALGGELEVTAIVGGKRVRLVGV